MLSYLGPVAFLTVAISQYIGIGGAVVGRIWISHASGSDYGCRVRDRTGRRSTDGAGSFIGNSAVNRHGDGIVNVTSSAGREPRSCATLTSGIRHAREDTREVITDHSTGYFTRPKIGHDDSVSILVYR